MSVVNYFLFNIPFVSKECTTTLRILTLGIMILGKIALSINNTQR
jgi:hypothetical protein